MTAQPGPSRAEASHPSAVPSAQATPAATARRAARDGAAISADAHPFGSAERMRSWVQEMPVMVCAVDEQLNILAWNRQCELVTGYSAAEVVGNPRALELLLPDPANRQDVVSTWQQRRNNFLSWEIESNAKDGTPRTIVWSNLSRLFPVSGWASWSVGIDVSQRRRADETLQRSNHLLRVLNRAQSKFIEQAAPQEVFNELLEELLRMTGSQFGFVAEVLRDAQQQPYLKSLALTNVAWNAETQALYEAALAQGMEFHNLQTLFGAVLTSGKPVVSNDPARDPRSGGLPAGHPPLHSFLGLPISVGEQLVGMVGLANRRGGFDQHQVQYLQLLVTACGGIIQAHRLAAQRERAVAALRESEQRFSHLAEAIDQVFWFDEGPPHRVLYVNSAFERVWGHTPEELYANPSLWIERIHPEDREAVRRHFADFIEGRAPYYEASYRIVRADGSIRWIDDQGTRLPDGRRFSGIARDTTDRRRAEEESRQRQAELAHMMRLDTLGKMVSELAHELNQPLYAVSNYASACRTILARQPDQQLDAELMHCLRQISEQANRAGQILRRIGGFARNEPPARDVVAIDELLRDILSLVEIDARRHDYRIRAALGEWTALVLVDRVQIEQVLVNLLLNAIDATGELPGPRREAVLACDCGRDEVTVTVCDRGLGVRPENLPKLFEPFFSTKPHGMGMGLAISRSIIEAHGGRLWATVNPDHGMTFHLTLPLVNEEVADDR